MSDEQPAVPLITMPTAPRACDGCGGTDVAEVWRYQCQSRNPEARYQWDVRIVVCRHCGFAFVSPAPTSEALSQYYAGTFAQFAGQDLDYAIERRLQLIRAHIPAGARPRFIEVGSNAGGAFPQALQALVSELSLVELNASCDRTHATLSDVPPDSADMLAAYFVLEHVPDSGAFLAGCARALRPGGILIIEVPDVYGYPQDVAGLLLYEHVNHFSPRTLARVAARQGLSLLDVSYEACSRSFGFAAVFAKNGAAAAAGPDPLEYKQAVACLCAGRARIEAFWAEVRQARESLVANAAQGGTAVIWGANDQCLRLLDGFEPPVGCQVVDANPLKREFLSPVPVTLPQDSVAAIRAASRFVINTRLHQGTIRRWIADHCDRHVTDDEVIVLDLA